MERSTRCAWIKQNDANAAHTPFLCGAAAAQMILYGRDNSKFQVGNPTKLKDSPLQLRLDQQRVWDKIIDRSSTCPLPPGGHYDGNPEQTQICESNGKCWATYPEALARTLKTGVTVTAGPVAGVSARVQALASDSDLPEAIVDSLDRGVAPALLIDGTHWVVVYRYRELDQDAFEIYYRDGMVSRRSSTFWNDDAFFLHADKGTRGVFRGKYVAVTASSRVPVVRDVIGLPPVRVPGRPQVPVLLGDKREFTPEVAERLRGELLADKEWAPAFAGAHVDRVLSVRNLSPGGTDYYLVDFVAPRLESVTTSPRRVGSVIVDAYQLRRRSTLGTSAPEEELPSLVAIDEVLRRIHLLNIPGAHIEPELVWEPSDQSWSPFAPFHVVRAPGRPDIARFVRADGEVVDELTHHLAGI